MKKNIKTSIKFLCLFLLLGVFVIVIFSILSLIPNPTEQDKIKMNELKDFFGSKYAFSFGSDIYLKAQAKSQNSPTHDDAIKIYNLFWFNKENKIRKNTNYVYLNIYSQNGDFVFQVYWDPKKLNYGFSHKEYY
jgi:hypothetical protein